MKNTVQVFAPASIANLSCGFDVLGLCLEGVGDTMSFQRTSDSGIQIINKNNSSLPTDPKQNVAGVAAQALLDAHPIAGGVLIEIEKGILPGSGIGSSAASAVGAVVGINQLLENPLPKQDLLPFALAGEAMASKDAHADNIAPALLGGIILVRSVYPMDLVKLPVPKDLFAVVLHPQIELKTAEARALLGDQVLLKNAIQQWANVGALVHALHTDDESLMARSLQDVIAEPLRKKLIPEFDRIQKIALQEGALGCGISGAGPSIFSLVKGAEKSQNIAHALSHFCNQMGMEHQLYTSPINKNGVEIISSK